MNFRINAALAVWFTLLIALVWVAPLAFGVDVGGEIRGITIAAFILIVQYFYRKKPPKGEQ